MKSFFPTLLITFCLLLGGAVLVNAQTRQQDQGPMTNAEVVKLSKAGFKEKTIVLIISSRIPNFDLSSDKMIQLKRAGVSENIIIAKQKAMTGCVRARPDRSSMFSNITLPRRRLKRQAKAPSVMAR